MNQATLDSTGEPTRRKLSDDSSAIVKKEGTFGSDLGMVVVAPLGIATSRGASESEEIGVVSTERYPPMGC